MAGKNQLNARLDEKTIYLLDLAGRITGRSQTELIRQSLHLLFETISPYREQYFLDSEDRSNLSTTEYVEKQQAAAARCRAESLAKNAELLWDERPFVRLQILSMNGFAHLQTEQDHIVWKHLFTRRDLTYTDSKKQLVLETQKVVKADWEQIRQEALGK